MRAKFLAFSTPNTKNYIHEICQVSNKFGIKALEVDVLNANFF